MEALPYGVWGGGCDAATLPAGQRRAGAEVGWRAALTLSIDRRRRTGDGAPYDVWESISVKPTLSVIQRKGRRGRRPLRRLRNERRGMLCKWYVCPTPHNGARAVPAGLNVLGGGHRLAHRGKHGCNRSRRTGAPNQPRQSRGHGAPRTVHPTGDSETGLAAYNVTGAGTTLNCQHTSRLC